MFRSAPILSSNVNFSAFSDVRKDLINLMSFLKRE